MVKVTMAAEPGVETIDAVCDEIEQLGVDAEGPVVDLGLLPRALGAKCRTWPFFRADERCLPIDRPRDDAPPDVHIALNPGHYFLLYPDDPARELFEEGKLFAWARSRYDQLEAFARQRNLYLPMLAITGGLTVLGMFGLARWARNK